MALACEVTEGRRENSESDVNFENVEDRVETDPRGLASELAVLGRGKSSLVFDG